MYLFLFFLVFCFQIQIQINSATNNILLLPGDLIASEFLGIQSFPGGINQNVEVAIYRLLYWTMPDPNNNKLAPARTLVFQPVQYQNSFLVFYAHPTIGINCKCSISNNGTNLNKINSVPALSTFISLGYTVIEPDYYGFICEENQIHPYLVGYPVATSILDAIRTVAFRWFPEKNVFVSNQIFGFGWSQGGHAILWTQALAPVYAPEFNIAVAGAIAPPTFLSLLVNRNLGIIPGKYLTILGLYSWPTYYSFLSQNQLVIPKKRRQVDQLANVCILTSPEKNWQLFPLLTLGRSSNWLKQNPTTHPLWDKMLIENTPPLQVFTHLFVFQGKKDDLVLWNVTQAWVQSLPKEISFYLYDNENHRSVIQQAMPILIYAFESIKIKINT